jgi:site-specific DNA recombinase
MESKTTKIAAIWARVSSKGQEEMSPEGQVERVRPKLEDAGYVIPEENIFKVTWSSLDLEPCPEFQTLSRLIKEDKIQALGFLDRDRLEAQEMLRLNFFSTCTFHNVKLVAFQGPEFIEGSVGLMVEHVLAMGKKLSVERAQSGAKQGLADRVRRKGLPPTSTKVYGMRSEKDGPYKPDQNYNNACLIFKLWFEKPNILAIGRELARQGIPSPRGNPIWNTTSVINMLKNPIYAGRVAALRYESVEPINRRKAGSGKTSVREKPESEWHYLPDRVEKPIITWEEHEAIKERLLQNKQWASKNAHRKYLLKGLIDCQICGGHYFGTKNFRGKLLYVCAKRSAIEYGKKCPVRPIEAERLEASVKEYIRNFLENPEVSFSAMERRANLQDNTMSDIGNELQQLEKDYRKTFDEERRWAGMVVSGQLSEEAYEPQRKLILTRRNHISERTDKQKDALVTLRKTQIKRATIEELRKRLQVNLDKATEDDWRMILETVGARVLAFGDGTWEATVALSVGAVPVDDVEIVNKTSHSSYISPPYPASPNPPTSLYVRRPPLSYANSRQTFS